MSVSNLLRQDSWKAVQLTAVAEDSQLSFSGMTISRSSSSPSKFSWILEIKLRTWTEDETASEKYPISPLAELNLFQVWTILARSSSNWSRRIFVFSNQAEMALNSSVVPLVVAVCVERSRECWFR
jgi:hypothetical protein